MTASGMGSYAYHEGERRAVEFGPVYNTKAKLERKKVAR
jgi:hypothetical protein